MKNSIWDSPIERQPAEASRGKNIMQDWSGLYQPENAAPNSIKNHLNGAAAQQHAEESARRALNEGESFPGFLAKRQIKHVTLYVGMHPRYGLCAYVSVPATPSAGKVEILINETREAIVLPRNEFFGELTEQTVDDQLIEGLCRAYYRWHISMEKT